MDFCVRPCGELTGCIEIPGDKSISHRALLFMALTNGQSVIKNCLLGEDNRHTISVLQQLGVAIQVDESAATVTVTGVGLYGLQAPDKPLDCGNSGTLMRLLIGILVAQPFTSTLIGDESLMTRPMQRIAGPLTQMGADITLSATGSAPVVIHPVKALTAITYTLPIASAQLKSAILLAGLYASSKTTIIEPQQSRDHTERLLAAMGYPITCSDQQITLTGQQPLRAIDCLTVPGDISSAAFFMVAASLVPGSSITLKNVGINPTRQGIIAVLQRMGANIQLENKRESYQEWVADITVNYQPSLIATIIQPEEVPIIIDEIPVLAIAAACAIGKTQFKGIQELRVKESDRALATVSGLHALGIDATVDANVLSVVGGKLSGGRINSFGDHRIAMAFAVAACVTKNPVTIENGDNIITSFPNFFVLAKQLGFVIDIL